MEKKRRWESSHWNEREVLLGVSVCSLGGLGFLALAWGAPSGEYLATETRILRWFRTVADPAVGIGPSWLPDIARDVTALGSGTVLTLLVALVVSWLVFRGRYRMAWLIFISTAGGWLVESGLKWWIGRTRPTAVPALVHETSMSFPSGHAMISSVVYLTLAALLARTVERWREKIFLVVAAAGLSFFIGVSRVYLGVHYPSDVAAGWAAGAAWASLCGTVAWWLQRHGQLRAAKSTDVSEEIIDRRREKD